MAVTNDHRFSALKGRSLRSKLCSLRRLREGPFGLFQLLEAPLISWLVSVSVQSLLSSSPVLPSVSPLLSQIRMLGIGLGSTWLSKMTSCQDPRLHLQRPFFQIRSHSQPPGLGSVHIFGGRGTQCTPYHLERGHPRKVRVSCLGGPLVLVAKCPPALPHPIPSFSTPEQHLHHCTENGELGANWAPGRKWEFSSSLGQGGIGGHR